MKFKRPLVLVLVLALAMSAVTGGTIAWFTDEVTSANNVITSGTLDIELEDGTSIGANMFQDHLWEPGAVAVKAFNVENVGTLALRYKTSLYWEDGNTLDGHSLKEAIKVAVLTELPANANNQTSEGRQALLDAAKDKWVSVSDGWNESNMFTEIEGTLNAGQTTENGLVIVAYWEPTADDNNFNANNGKVTSDGNPLYINLGMKVIATQDTVESDSFDNQYDAGAWDAVASEAPLDEEMIDDVRTIYVSTPEELAKLAQMMSATQNPLVAGRVEILKDIDLGGRLWTPINYWKNEHDVDLVIDGNGHSIRNMTVEGGSNSGFIGTYAGWVKTPDHALTIENLTFVDPQVETTGSYAGVVIGYQYGKVNLKNVDIQGGSVSSSAKLGTCLGGLVGFSVQNDGAQLNLNDCDVAGMTITGYHSMGALVGTTKNDAYQGTVDNCTASNNTLIYSATGGVGAHDFGSGSSGYVTLKPSGFALGQNTIVRSYKVGTAEDLKALNNTMVDKKAGKNFVIELTDDIDFSGYTWIPVDSHADTSSYIREFNGNGHTISNLTIDGQAMFTRFAGFGDVVVKDVTFDNATVNSTALNSSILTVQSYQNVLLDNVDVTNSSITGAYKVAPLIATVYDEKSGTVTATLKNCDVSNTTVKATTYDFCTAGLVAFVNAGDNDKIEFENCSVSNVKLIAPDDNYDAHAFVYTTGSGSLYNQAEGVTVTNCSFEILK